MNSLPAEAPAERGRSAGFVAWLCKALMGVFFREVEVMGRERLPRGVPLLLVANHHNSLVDPALLLAHLDVDPRFLAKSTLWHIPVMRRLLDLASVIPVYRRQDEGADTSRNQETFARCHEELAAGGAIALFPEGISHDAPHLAELKTGAARIALEAEERFGPLGTWIIPVGLTFEEKGTFRSRALIRIGTPIDVSAWQADQARTLTDAIREGLAEVTLNYPSAEDVRAVETAGDLMAGKKLELPSRMALDEAFAVRRDFIAAGERLRELFPERMRALQARLEKYAEDLHRIGVRDDQIAARYRKRDIGLYVLGSASLMLFWLPMALVGTLIHFVPYRLCGVVARFMKTEDLPATMKLFSSFFLFPITWALVAAAVWGAAGPWWAFFSLIVTPVTGFFAMLFHERHEFFWSEVDAYLSLKLRHRSARQLREEREALRAELHGLADLDPKKTDPTHR
ncbi:MAG: hypothetical protein GY937_26755 [bacterium]|nr:hypothetical protein [bacterium]